MSRPWIVKAIALLLMLAGLQAGAFQDLDTKQKRYFGTEDAGVSVLAEARKADPAVDTPPARGELPARPGAQAPGSCEMPSTPAAPIASGPYRPFDSTGPPRA